MKINTAALIYYSATGTTKKVLEAITKGLEIGKPKLINLTSLKPFIYIWPGFYNHLPL